MVTWEGKHWWMTKSRIFREPEIPGKSNLIYHLTLESCGDPPSYEKMPVEQRFQISDRKRERGNFYFR